MTVDSQRLNRLRVLDATRQKENYSAPFWYILEAISGLSEVYPVLEDVIDSTLYLLEAADEYNPAVENPYQNL